MSLDEIDRILSPEEEILPSSGFTASVMDAVRREAAAPQPIPFPWKRASPGVALAGLAMVFAVIIVADFTRVIRQASAVRVPSTWMSALAPIFHDPLHPEAVWLAVAFVVTLASIMVSFRLASGRA